MPFRSRPPPREGLSAEPLGSARAAVPPAATKPLLCARSRGPPGSRATWSGGRRSVVAQRFLRTPLVSRRPPKEPLRARLRARSSRTAVPALLAPRWLWALPGSAARPSVRCGARPHSGTSRSNAAFRGAVFLSAGHFSTTHRFHPRSPFFFLFSRNVFVIWLAFSDAGIHVSLRPLR